MIYFRDVKKIYYETNRIVKIVSSFNLFSIVVLLNDEIREAALYD